MRRAILAQSDRVVRVNVDHVAMHDVREPDGRSHVVRENQERRSVRNDAAKKRHSVHDRAHAVLANPEMEVATGVVLGGKTRLTLDDRVGGAGEIGGASHQLGNFLADGVDDDAGRGATRNISILCRERWDRIFPSLRQFTAQPALKLLFEAGICGFVRVVDLLPFTLCLRSAFCCFAPIAESLRRNVKRFLRGISKRLLGQLYLVLAQRRAVCFSSVVLVRAAVTNV